MLRKMKPVTLFIAFIAFLIIPSCKKEDLNWDLPRTNSLDSLGNAYLYIPTIITSNINSISTNSASSGGIGINDFGQGIISKGVCWGTSSNPTVNNSHTNDGTGNGDFGSQIFGLSSNTTYYVRAYATNNYGTGYGENISFVTTTIQLATISTISPFSISSNSAVSGGNIISNGGTAIISSGICWATSINPTISDNHTTSGTTSGNFQSQMTNLNPSTTYHVRAYATTANGTGYGQDINFTTSSLPLPVLTTSYVSNISFNSATSGGNISSDGGSIITSSGICWATSINPTISDNHTTDGTTSGNFQSQMTNLNPSTTYHVRAYATTASGTGYGQDISFTTLDTPTATAVGAENCSDLTNIAASLYYGMNGTTDNWGISPNGYSGACWVAPDPNNSGALGTTVGNFLVPHFIQFNHLYYNAGYFEFWIKTPNGQGGNNVIPTILIDGVNTIGTTIIGGQIPGVYWLKLRTDDLSAGWHNISIQFAGSYYYFFVDEITFFEY
jgi:hypothetical protein